MVAAGADEAVLTVGNTVRVINDALTLTKYHSFFAFGAGAALVSKAIRVYLDTDARVGEGVPALTATAAIARVLTAVWYSAEAVVEGKGTCTSQAALSTILLAPRHEAA